VCRAEGEGGALCRGSAALGAGVRGEMVSQCPPVPDGFAPPRPPAPPARSSCRRTCCRPPARAARATWSWRCRPGWNTPRATTWRWGRDARGRGGVGLDKRQEKGWNCVARPPAAPCTRRQHPRLLTRWRTLPTPCPHPRPQVLPINGPGLVASALQVVGLTGEERFLWTAGAKEDGPARGWSAIPSGGPVKALGDAMGGMRLSISAAMALAYMADLSALPPQKLVARLAAECPCPPEAAALAKLATPEGYAAGIVGPKLTLVELLAQFKSVKFTLPDLINTLPRLAPRYYSISSSPLADARRCSITVGLVNYTCAAPAGAAPRPPAPAPRLALARRCSRTPPPPPHAPPPHASHARVHPAPPPPNAARPPAAPTAAPRAASSTPSPCRSTSSARCAACRASSSCPRTRRRPSSWSAPAQVRLWVGGCAGRWGRTIGAGALAGTAGLRACGPRPASETLTPRSTPAPTPQAWRP
jgi:hypothetical protein